MNLPSSQTVSVRRPRSNGTAEEARNLAGPPAAVYLRFVTGLLRRHALLVLLVTLSISGMVGWYLWRTPELYEAGAVVRINPVRRALAPGIEATPSMGTFGVDMLQTQIEILRSRRVIGRAVDASGVRLQPQGTRALEAVLQRVLVDPAATTTSLQLQFQSSGYVVVGMGDTMRASYGDTLSVGGVRFAIRERPEGVDLAQLSVISRDAAIGRVTGRTSVLPRRGTEILDVRYRSESPVQAMEMVNHVVETFFAVDAEIAQQQARRRREFLERQVATNDSLLTEAQLALSSFRMTSRPVADEGSAQARASALVDVELRRRELQEQAGNYSELLEKLRTSPESERGERLRVLMASPGITMSLVVEHLYSELLSYQTTRDTLLTSGSQPTNPDVQRLDRLIEATEEDLVEAIGSHITALESRIETLAELRQSTAGEIRAASPAPESEVTALQLQEQVETIKQTADLVRAEFQKARIEEAVEAGQVEVLDLATGPGSLVQTSRGRTLTLATLVAFLLAGGLAYVRETLDTALHMPDEVETVASLPTLATVPRLTGGHRRRLSLRKNGNEATEEEASGEVSSRHYIESFRMLGTSLAYSLLDKNGSRHRTILVTSALPAEGKSTTAANLAVAQAEAGYRVVVVDCDVTRPSLHKLFRVGSTPGLVQVLQNHVEVHDVLRHTAFGTAFLPAGANEDGVLMALKRTGLLNLIETLSKSYDRIILDAPPVLLMSNTMVLSTIADAVVLVVRAGSTDRSIVREAITKLELVGAPIVGTVLNDPDGEVPRYAGPYYQSYYTDDV